MVEDADGPLQGGAGEEGEDGEAGSFQAYSNPGESSGGYADLDIQPAASTGSQNDELGGGMGSMTGWRAIAAQVSRRGCVHSACGPSPPPQ